MNRKMQRPMYHTESGYGFPTPMVTRYNQNMFEEFQTACDTDPAVEEYMLNRLRRMPLSEKLQRCFALSSSLRAFVRAGIQLRFPDADENEIKMRLAALTLGRFAPKVTH